MTQSSPGQRARSRTHHRRSVRGGAGARTLWLERLEDRVAPANVANVLATQIGIDLTAEQISALRQQAEHVRLTRKCQVTRGPQPQADPEQTATR